MVLIENNTPLDDFRSMGGVDVLETSPKRDTSLVKSRPPISKSKHNQILNGKGLGLNSSDLDVGIKLGE